MARIRIRVDMKGPAEAARRHFADLARKKHAEVLAAAPTPTGFTRIVDGRVGASEDAVKVGGRILYLYERMDEIVRFSMATLEDLSPALHGDYRRSHVLLINGQPANDLSSYEPGDDVAIMNPMPYARKIEVGAMVMAVPGSDHVYRQARAVIMRRFGNQASVEFTFRAFIGERGVNQALTATHRYRRMPNRVATGEFERTLPRGLHNNPDLRFPCLVFHPAGTQVSKWRRK